MMSPASPRLFWVRRGRPSIGKGSKSPIDDATNKSPQSFNQIEIGRIGRQKQQLNAEPGGLLQDKGIALIAGVVQHDGVGEIVKFLLELPKQLKH